MEELKRLEALMAEKGFLPLERDKEGMLRGGFAAVTASVSNNCECDYLPNNCKCGGNNCSCPPNPSNNCDCGGNNCNCYKTHPVPTPKPSTSTPAPSTKNSIGAVGFMFGL